MARWLRALAAAVLAVLPLGRCSTSGDNNNGARWVDIWGAMPQLTEEGNLPPSPFNQPGVVFRNATVRQTVRVTLDAPTIRLRISNAFGGSDLPITAVTVAFARNGTSGVSGINEAAGAGSGPKEVTFSAGRPGFVVPNGALVVSDPVPGFAVRAFDVLTVSIYLAEGQTTNLITSHPGSRTTSWFLPGNRISAPQFEGLEGVGRADHWYFLSRVEGLLGSSGGGDSGRAEKQTKKLRRPAALVVVGDSISDGRGSTTNGNDRWPDVLASRLAAADLPVSVINQAAGGNRVLRDGLGPNALGRVDRDVIAGSGVAYAVVFEGVNDIGTTDAGDDAALAAVVERLVSAYRQVVARLHSHGIAVFGATITPMSGPGQVYGEPGREKARLAVNRWIREGGAFDAVLDFDAVVRDRDNGTMLRREFDVGDYLHLNPAGYRAMAESVDLGLFERFQDGVWGLRRRSRRGLSS